MALLIKRSAQKVIVLCLALCLALLAPGWLPAPVAEAASATSVVDWNDEKQVMDGLGGAFAFNKADGIKQIYDADPRIGRELLDLIFSKEKGIGLSIVRVIIGDGGITNPATGAEWGNRFYDGPSDTVWPDKDGGFVWDRPDWDSKKASFDAAQIWIMQEALSYGIDTFYADAWSPPYWMKTNNSVLGQNGAKLKPESYQDYADYLVQYAIGYKREFGIPITHIGPANESEAAHASYSGFVITSAEYKDFIQNYLGPTLQKAIDEGEFARLDMEPPHIVAPEGTNLNASLNLGRAMLEDPASSQYIDVFSTHLYGTTSFNNGPMASTGATGAYPEFLRNFKLWQTEYMTQNGNNTSANSNTQIHPNQSITDGVYWGNLLTHMFTSDPGFNAFLWWWPISNNGADGSDLIRLATTGSPQGSGSTVTGQYRAFKRLYTFGNFSRFIRPDDVRIEATRVPVAGTNITAYKNPANNEFSIVAVNSGAASHDITFELKDFPADTTAVVGYRTTASENQKLMDPIEISGGAFTATLPANSVITFVPKTNHNLPGLTTKRDIFSTFEAEDNDGASGVFASVPSGAGNVLSGAGNGDFIRFANVNFADGSANGGIVRRHILSMNAIAASLNGGIIEVRIDDPRSGRVVGAFHIPGRDDGTEYASYPIQIDTGDNAAYGYHDVYMVFRGNGKELFNIDRFEFGSEVLPTATLLTNGSFEAVPGAVWTPHGAPGATLERTTAQNYSAPVTATNSTTAYSILLSNRAEESSGIAQDITGKLTDGAKYKVNGFFMPSTSGVTGSIQLVALDAEGGVVETKTVAERNNLQAMVWSQVDSVFTFEAPDADYVSLKLVYTDSGTGALYVDEAALVPYVDKSELIRVLSSPTNPNSYAEEDWQALQLLLEEGWQAAIDTASTQTAVDELALRVTDALVPAPVATLSGPEQVTAGETLSLTVGLEGHDGKALAQDFTISFDAGKLQFASASSLGDNFVVVDHEVIAPGQVRVLTVFLGELQENPNDSLMRLHFQVGTGASSGYTSIAISDATLADDNAVEIPLAGSSHTVRISAIDKTSLANLIAEAEEQLDDAVEGKQIGQYPVGSKAVLAAAIAEAKGVLNASGSTQADIGQAEIGLREALQTFRASVIDFIPGDYNNDNKVSVGDLSIIVKSYGKTSADPDWNAVKNSDLNDDGLIDIVDLVLMARMIFNW